MSQKQRNKIIAIAAYAVEQASKKPRNGLPGRNGIAGKNGIDGKDGKDGKDGERGPLGYPGPKGLPGPRGFRGEKGENGKDGRDGKDGKNGRAGKNGINGRDGKDGRGIVDADIDDNGHLVLLYSDGAAQDVGRVVGRDGKDGAAVTMRGGGGGRENVRTVTSDTSVGSSDNVILADATAGDVTVTLPNAAKWKRPLTIKRINATGGNVIVQAQPGQQIENEAFRTITVNLYAIKAASDNSNWWEV